MRSFPCLPLGSVRSPWIMLIPGHAGARCRWSAAVSSAPGGSWGFAAAAGSRPSPSLAWGWAPWVLPPLALQLPHRHPQGSAEYLGASAVPKSPSSGVQSAVCLQGRFFFDWFMLTSVLQGVSLILINLGENTLSSGDLQPCLVIVWIWGHTHFHVSKKQRSRMLTRIPCSVIAPEDAWPCKSIPYQDSQLVGLCHPHFL